MIVRYDMLRAERQHRGLTQKALAELSGLSFSTIEKLERGKRGFEPREETIRRLAAALQIDPDELLARPADAPSADKRRHAVTIELGGGSALSRTARSRLEWQDVLTPLELAHLEDHEEHDEYLDYLVRTGLDTDSREGRIVRHSAQLLAAVFERRQDDEAKRACARAHAIIGMSFGEASAAPPREAFIHLQRAQRLAHTIGDRSLVLLCDWALAQLWRKTGDVTKSPEAFAEARKSLDPLINHPGTSPLLRTAGFLELTKVALGQGADVAEPLSAGETEAAKARVGEGMSHDEPWTPFFSDLFQVLLRDAKLRALARDGGSIEQMGHIAEEARQFRDGLLPVTDQITLPYALARGVLRSPGTGDERRGEAVLLWRDAWRKSSQEGYQRQIWAGEQMLRDSALRANLPHLMQGQCRRCAQETVWALARGSNLAYKCSRCLTTQVELPNLR